MICRVGYPSVFLIFHHWPFICIFLVNTGSGNNPAWGIDLLTPGTNWNQLDHARIFPSLPDFNDGNGRCDQIGTDIIKGPDLVVYWVEYQCVLLTFSMYFPTGCFSVFSSFALH